MDESIGDVRFTPTVDDALLQLRYSSRLQRLFWLVGVIPSSILATLLMLFMGNTYPGIGILAASILGFLLFYVLMPHVIARRVASQHAEWSVGIDASGLQVTRSSGGTTVPWQRVARLEAAEEGAYLVYRSGNVMFVPRRAFAGPEAFSSFVASTTARIDSVLA